MDKKDMKWLAGFLIVFIGGFWKIWTFEVGEGLIIPLLKLNYTLFWGFAISVAIYFIIIKGENKNG